MKNESKYRLTIGMVVLFSTVVMGCSIGEKCSPSLFIREPAQKSLNIRKGAVMEFSAAATSCVGDTGFSYEWIVNGKPQGFENTFRFYACESASVPITVVVRATNSSGEVVEQKWTVSITDTGRIIRPQEVQDAIMTIKGNHTFNPAFPEIYTQSVTAFQQAVSVLDIYLNTTNACDFDASYADGLARLVLLLTRVPEYYKMRQQMTPSDVFQIIDEDMLPIVERLDVVRRYAPDNFSFKIDNLFVVVLEDLPDVPGNQFVAVDLSGEHDYTDVLFFSSGAAAGMAALHMALAYNGIVNFALSLPNPDEMVYLKKFAQGLTGQFILESAIIEKLEDDPTFLMLSPPDEKGIDGRGHLAIAQKLLAVAMRDFEAALGSLVSEPNTEADPQDDDLVRYWDCGSDGVCPGDPEERSNVNAPCEDANGNTQAYTDKNFNGECNPPHCDTDGDGQLDLTPDTNPYDPKKETVCVAPDEGEMNGQFDYGEPVGFEFVRVFKNETERYSLPVQDYIRNDILMLADNIEGVDRDGDGEPDPLNLNAFVPGFDVYAAMEAYGIPKPDIRLAEFFQTPSNLRDLVPLYARPGCLYHGFENQFIFTEEFEAFVDNGYDHLWSYEEPGYDAITNRDPSHDDYDPVCDPQCNSNDGWDNDQDGKCTPDECSACRSNYNNANFACDDTSSIGVNTDNGTEGNYHWDCKSPQEVSNGIQCAGDAEEFIDEGVFNGVEFIGANDGVYNRIDMEHIWPTDACIGGIQPGITSDPRNGVDSPSLDTLEENGNLYDPFYAFFPDPTFSGVIRFEEEIVNSDGEALNNNAKLMRFLTKLYNLAVMFGAID